MKPTRNVPQLSVLVLALALLPLALASCGGGGGGGGGDEVEPGAVSLAAPFGLRLEELPDDPRSALLEWEAPAQVGASRYRVFYSGVPIGDPPQDVGALDTDGTSVPVELIPGPGKLYLRVARRTEDGETGELSEQLVVELEERLVYSEQEEPFRIGLYSVLPNGADPRDLGQGVNVSPTQPLASPVGGQVVFLGSRDGATPYSSPTMYSVPMDGSEAPVDLCPPDVHYYNPGGGHLSPDGRFVVYRARELDLGVDDGLYVARPGVEASGRRYTPPGVDVSTILGVLPDSRTAVFKGERTTEETVFTGFYRLLIDDSAEPEVEVVYEHERPLFASDLAASILSPDGRSIAFVRRDLFGDGETSLYVVDLEDGEPRLLDTPAEVLTSSGVSWGEPPTLGVVAPTWSPDSAWLAYEFHLPGEPSEARVVRADGSTSPRRVHDDLYPERGVREVRFGPDSEALYFLSSTTSAAQYDLYGAPVESSEDAQRLTPDLPGFASITHFEVGPAGARIVYRADAQADERFDLFVVEPAQPGLVGRVNPTLQPQGSAVEPRFSRDGETVSYRADLIFEDNSMGYTSPAAGLGTGVRVAGTPAPDGSRTLWNLLWPVAGRRQ